MSRPAIVAEKAGIPSVVVVATSFLPLVHQVGMAEGLVDLRAAEYPGAPAVESADMIKEKFEKVTFDQIISALTKGVESSGGGSPELSTLEEVVFTGTIEEVNEFFRTNKWTDGLAIIPPTKKRIEEFLKYTDRPAHEQIAVLPTANLRATPWNIAANGVMAGCRPEYMPVLIAGVEALGDLQYNLEQMHSTGCMNPFFLINGPIIKQLKFEYGIGLVSRGPNPAVGRALSLVIRNIAGYRPGETYMGTFGYIMPFVLAEDEDRSPWEPFHVQYGFDRSTSTITAANTRAWACQIWPTGTNVEGLLKIICSGNVKWGNQAVPGKNEERETTTVLMTPGVAEGIARGGYSKRAAEAYLWENSRVTIREIEFGLKYGNSGSVKTLREVIEEGRAPVEWGNLGPDDTVPVVRQPGLIHIVVCGDPARNKAMVFRSSDNPHTIKEIKLPANWDELMAKVSR